MAVMVFGRPYRRNSATAAMTKVWRLRHSNAAYAANTLRGPSNARSESTFAPMALYDVKFAPLLGADAVISRPLMTVPKRCFGGSRQAGEERCRN